MKSDDPRLQLVEVPLGERPGITPGEPVGFPIGQPAWHPTTLRRPSRPDVMRPHRRSWEPS